MNSEETKEIPQDLLHDLLETFDYLTQALECQNNRTINMKNGLESLVNGSCTCLIKSPGLENHTDDCVYKRVSFLIHEDDRIIENFDLDRILDFLKSKSFIK